MTVLYIFYAIIGISIIIFIHELGHFLAAKKVGVRVDRFSVGFDPTLFGIRLRLLAFTKGETEYIIGLVPFGGYVKLAGETPMEQETHEAPVKPDWLIAKTPGQRALVFAAGAIFNIFSAFLFFGLAFSIGVAFISTEVGVVEPGMPAWNEGLRAGDTITGINGKPVNEFTELMVSVAFADTDETLEIEYARPGEDRPRTIEVKPVWNEVRGIQTIGVERPLDSKITAVAPESAAARAGIQGQDRVIGARLGGVEFTDLLSAHLLFRTTDEYLATHPGESVGLLIEHEGEGAMWKEVSFKKGSKQFGLLGVRAGYFAHVILKTQKDSFAAKHFRMGDRILSLNGKPISYIDWNSLMDAKGDSLALEVEHAEGSVENIKLERIALIRSLIRREIYFAGLNSRLREVPTPLAAAGLRAGDIVYQINASTTANTADVESTVVASQSGGVSVSIIREGRRVREAIQVQKSVLVDALGSGALWDRAAVVYVTPGSAAERIGIASGSSVLDINKEPVRDWVSLRESVAKIGESHFSISWVDPRGEKHSSTDATLETSGYEQLGLTYAPLQRVTRAGILDSTVLGIQRTVIVSKQVFLTLRALLKRQVKAQNLSGPIGIVHIIYRVSEFGIGTLIYFLALISVNLGILNLLPFPILDGGHLLYLLIEKIKGSPVSIRVQEVAATVAFVLIVSLALFVTYHDVVRLVHDWKSR